MAEDMKLPPVEHDAIYHHEEIGLPPEQRDRLYHSILEASRLDPEYLAMLALAALIALLGLVQNSVAVIIGAMLISPLMNPILAGGLALVLGDWKLGRRTGMVLVLSVVGAILITWFVALLVPLKQATPEILARTSPNLLDLFIAFLSGLAGTLALRAGPSMLTIIPGVAIAVAVIPPLAVVGYGLSTGQWATAAGAFLLFVTNLVSILISAALVFLLIGFRPGEEAEKGRLKLRYRMGFSCLVLLILAIPLIQTLRRGVTQVRLRSEVARILDQAFKTESSSVRDLNLTRHGESLQVRATVRTTEYFDSKDIEAAEKALRASFGPGSKLEVEQILVTQARLSEQQAARIRDFIAGGVVQPAPSPEQAPYDFKKGRDEMLAFLQRQLDEVAVVPAAPFRPLGPIRAQVGATQPLSLVVQLASPEPLEAQTIKMLAAQVSARLATPVALHGQVELEGPDYSLAIERPDTRRALTPADRQAVGKLLKVVQSRPDFQLTVAITSHQPAAEDTPAARLQREVEALLARSGLEHSRWSVEEIAKASPPAAGVAGANAAAAPPQPSSALICRFKVYQEF